MDTAEARSARTGPSISSAATGIFGNRRRSEPERRTRGEARIRERFRVSSIGAVGRAPPFFPILGGLGVGKSYDPYSAPYPWNPKPLSNSRLASCPLLKFRSASVAKSSCHCGTILGPVRADLASAVSTDCTHLAIVVSCRLLGRSELLLPTTKHAADCL